MKPNMRMNLLCVVACAGIALVASERRSLCQSEAPDGEIKSVEANRYIGLRIEVQAKDAQIVIPECGHNSESDEYHLCGLASRLQVRTGNEWRPVSVRRGLAGVLGGATKETWAPLLIAPGRAVYFTLTIDPAFLDVRRGDQLRVELDAWPSEAAMRTTEPEKRLTSPTFECP
jgi:hypothetical protein